MQRYTRPFFRVSVRRYLWFPLNLHSVHPDIFIYFYVAFVPRVLDLAFFNC